MSPSTLHSTPRSNRRRRGLRSGVAVGARGAHAGFSFVEMMIVVSILAIISAIALPKIDTHQMRVNAAIRGVRGTIQHAQRLALLRQHDVVVSIDLSKHRIRVFEDRDNDRSIDAGDKTIWTPLQENVRFAAPPISLRGTSASAVYTTKSIVVTGYNTIVFHANGAASAEFEIYINSSDLKPKHARAVAITQATGRAQWYRFVNGSWRAAGE